MKNTFLDNLTKIISGTLLAQLIGFFTLPIITRIYSPNAFGEFSLFVAVLGPIGMIITMGYELAILKPKKDKDAFYVVLIKISISVMNNNWLI